MDIARGEFLYGFIENYLAQSLTWINFRSGRHGLEVRRTAGFEPGEGQ
jgi:hypothetical protein